jgi:hypothetical protein
MLSTTRTSGLAVLAGVLLGPALAAAQAPPDAKQPLAPEKKLSGPKDCVKTRATPGPGLEARKPQGRAFSEELARADGVICPPPRTDPDMIRPAPGGGTMPIIPPPDSDKDHRGIAPK